MLNIRTVTVIGATGTMGANVAGIFASFGNAKVFCIGRDIEKVKQKIPQIAMSVKANIVMQNLIPADFSMLEKCLSESDLIFESAVEDMDIKKDIAKTISKTMSPHSIACTGTSGLSITVLAECFPEHLRSNFFGVHMFNPPYNMVLCELIPTIYSSEIVKKELKEYLQMKLYRTVVEVKDSPAFLGNRIGFQFINEAIQFAEKYKDNGGIDYIDAILGQFTGRSMSPIVTADFVGLDVHKAIVDNIFNNSSDYARTTFVLPSFINKLVNDGKLGRKTGIGLYQIIRNDEGKKSIKVFDIKTVSYRDIGKYSFPFSENMRKNIANGDYQGAINSLLKDSSVEANICTIFLLKYIIYSIYMAKEVGHSIDDADDVMATGFNWCPPLAMIQAINTVIDIKELIRERMPEVYEQLDLDSYLTDIHRSKYDYRVYLKSGR